jgi:MFS family permease
MGSGRGRLTAGLALTEFVAGMQLLVVVAAMPQVLKDLGGVEFYGTIFSGYMLAGLVSIPLAGRTADRKGPTKPFVRGMLLFGVGSLLCALAPSMPLLAVARLVQGYGGGAAYTIAYGAIAKAYPSATRPRMLLLLTFTWIVAGLIAPSIGAILATTVGWRWAFVIVVPLVVMAILLTAPGLSGMGGAEGVPHISPTWPVVLAVACALGLIAGSQARWWSIPLALVAVVGTLLAMQRLMPRGWLRAAPGAPSAVILNLLIYLAFFTADSFITLLLTDVRGVSIAEAGVAVTLVAISWSAGSWWQSRAITRHSAALLTRAGSAVFVAGTAGVVALLFGAPLWLGYASWMVAGLGVGVAFPTLILAAMDFAGRGDETTAIAARFVSGRVGIILGTGLGGAAIATTHAAGRPLAWGLAAVFAVALSGGVACVLVAGRLRAPAAAEQRG